MNSHIRTVVLMSSIARRSRDDLDGYGNGWFSAAMDISEEKLDLFFKNNAYDKTNDDLSSV
jgi:hypothetical protein